jgi:hypothetical protein
MGTFFSNEQLPSQPLENVIFLLNSTTLFQLQSLALESIFLFTEPQSQPILSFFLLLPLLLLLQALLLLLISSELLLFLLAVPKSLLQFLIFLKPHFLQQFLPLFLIFSKLLP